MLVFLSFANRTLDLMSSLETLSRAVLKGKNELQGRIAKRWDPKRENISRSNIEITGVSSRTPSLSIQALSETSVKPTEGQPSQFSFRFTTQSKSNPEVLMTRSSGSKTTCVLQIESVCCAKMGTKIFRNIVQRESIEN